MTLADFVTRLGTLTNFYGVFGLLYAVSCQWRQEEQGGQAGGCQGENDEQSEISNGTEFGKNEPGQSQNDR